MTHVDVTEECEPVALIYIGVTRGTMRQVIINYT